jgi:hypothetical protein
MIDEESSRARVGRGSQTTPVMAAATMIIVAVFVPGAVPGLMMVLAALAVLLGGLGLAEPQVADQFPRRFPPFALIGLGVVMLAGGLALDLAL